MRPTDTILRQLGVSFVTELNGISEYRLNSNSLKIVLVPDPSARVVAVVQHVNVGSRHEGAGNTGYSHLLEHMLFKGTPTFNAAKGNSYDDFMKRLGGEYNATTWYDRTNYFAKVPSAYLGQYLEYEADRLRNAIITDADLATEMPVVVDEFDRGENDPDQVADKLLNATLWTEHPYKVDTIGARSEVLKVTAASLRERLYEVYYYPNNTTVIICGGFDVLEALQLVVKHYGDIAPSPRPIPVPYTIEPPQMGERRFVINKAGDLPRVVMGFHVPQADHDDTYAINALATILGGGEASRLHKRLVNKGLASQVYAYSQPLRDPGAFKVYAKLTPGTKPEKVERIILAEIARISERLVSKSELQRTKVQNRAGTVQVRTNKLRYASAISENEAAADWKWGATYDDRFDEVTRESIRDVAQRYLHADNRCVGYFLPKADKPAPEGNKPDTSSQTPEPTGTASFASQVAKTVLPNGLTVMLMPSETAPAVGVSFLTRAGSYCVPGEHLMPHLVAKMLPEGSAKYTKDRIAQLASEMLVGFHFGDSAFRTELNTNVVPSDLPRFLDLLADVVCNPKFEQQGLDLVKTTMAAELHEMGQDPRTRAQIALRQSFYAADSAHYHPSIEALTEQLQAVTTDGLREFHRKFYSPKGTTLCLVGKFNAEEALKLIEAKFGTWTGDDVPAPQAVPFNGSPANRNIQVHIEGKDNLTILVGIPVDLSVASPDYVAAHLAIKALGGDTLTSRLGKEIREKRGLTYGITCHLDEPLTGGGLWIIQMTCSADKVKQAIPLIAQVVAEYTRDGIGGAEMELERDGMVNAFAMQLDAPVQIARTVAQYDFSGRGVSALDSYGERVLAVSKDDVDACIRKYLRVPDAVTVVAGTLKG